MNANTIEEYHSVLQQWEADRDKVIGLTIDVSRGRNYLSGDVPKKVLDQYFSDLEKLEKANAAIKLTEQKRDSLAASIHKFLDNNPEIHSLELSPGDDYNSGIILRRNETGELMFNS